MKIADFLNFENKQIDHLSCKDKARALLTSVINELRINGSVKKSHALINFMNKADYILELVITKQFLKYYIDSGNFNLITMPYPDTRKGKERNNAIKKSLQNIFKP